MYTQVEIRKVQQRLLEMAVNVRDILEKSIVASLAKDVIVGVKKENVEMKIIMELTGK